MYSVKLQNMEIKNLFLTQNESSVKNVNPG